MSHVLRERYENEVVPALMESLNLSNIMQVPRLQKIVVKTVKLSDFTLDIGDRNRVFGHIEQTGQHDLGMPEGNTGGNRYTANDPSFAHYNSRRDTTPS